MKKEKLPRNVIVLGVVSLLTDMSSDMIVPLLPLFITSTLGAGPAALGIIEGIAEATASFLKLLSGAWADRVSRKKPLVVKELAQVVSDTALRVQYARFEAPKGRAAGKKVKDVAELVDMLRNEAKVI